MVEMKLVDGAELLKKGRKEEVSEVGERNRLHGEVLKTGKFE